MNYNPSDTNENDIINRCWTEGSYFMLMFIICKLGGQRPHPGGVARPSLRSGTVMCPLVGAKGAELLWRACLLASWVTTAVLWTLEHSPVKPRITIVNSCIPLCREPLNHNREASNQSRKPSYHSSMNFLNHLLVKLRITIVSPRFIVLWNEPSSKEVSNRCSINLWTLMSCNLKNLTLKTHLFNFCARKMDSRQTYAPRSVQSQRGEETRALGGFLLLTKLKLGTKAVMHSVVVLWKFQPPGQTIWRPERKQSVMDARTGGSGRNWNRQHFIFQVCRFPHSYFGILGTRVDE